VKSKKAIPGLAYLFLLLALLHSACSSSIPSTPYDLSNVPSQITALIPKITFVPAVFTATSNTPNAPYTFTKTLDYSKFTGVWKKYHNSSYGFSFEYPAIYDEAPYTPCGVKTNQDAVSLGGRSDLLILDPNGLGLKDFIDQTIKTKGYSLQAQKNELIDGYDSITIEYRFGGLNRFGTFTMFKRGSLVFAFGFTAGAACDIPESQLFEIDAYQHMIMTFHFDK
jgi:hypothetical protein